MELLGKRNKGSHSSSAMDANHQILKIGDVVNIAVTGASKRSATIKHIFKATLWVHSDTWLKDSGISAVRARHCTLIGSKGGMKSAQLINSTPLQGVAVSSVGSGAGGGGGGGRKPGRDEAIGKTVKITKGAYKGYLAHVVDVTVTHYSVELHTKLKRISIERDKVKIVGDKEGAIDRENTRENALAGDILLSRATPSHVPATPRVSGYETPMHGTPSWSNTPSRDDVDSWRPSERDLPSQEEVGGAGGAVGWDTNPDDSNDQWSNASGGAGRGSGWGSQSDSPWSSESEANGKGSITQKAPEKLANWGSGWSADDSFQGQSQPSSVPKAPEKLANWGSGWSADDSFQGQSQPSSVPKAPEKLANWGSGWSADDSFQGQSQPSSVPKAGKSLVSLAVPDVIVCFTTGLDKGKYGVLVAPIDNVRHSNSS